MSWTMRVVSTFAAVTLGSACTSCDREKAEQVEIETLPYLQATHHPELRAELARLQAERATPQLLDASGPTEADGTTARTRAKRLVNELNGVYPLQKLRLTLQRVERFYPAGKFRFDPIELEKARAIERLCRPQLDRYRKVFQRAGFQFDVSLRDGLLADLSLLDHAKLAHRLEALLAADVLAGGQPSEALLPLRNMLMIDTRLAAVPNVSARRAGAHLRAEALEVAAALVEHPRCSLTLRDELLRILETQLHNWTPDRAAWVGDRALGIHAYELVRDGQLMSILTVKEIAKLKSDGNLAAFDEAVRLSLDEDEWFYLSTMRRVIDACDKPFFERGAMFDEINQEVDKLFDTPRFPLFATKVLLPNLASVQREQAIDRARCEAWVIALRAASGKPIELPGPNPVTGKPYNLAREIDAMVIRDLAGERDEKPAVTIPVLEQ